jgi:hypothetical protein
VGHKFNPRQGYLSQRLVWQTKMKKRNNNQHNASSWSSPEAKFIVQWFEVAQETLTFGELP